jgi:hypothetical protein
MFPELVSFVVEFAVCCLLFATILSVFCSGWFTLAFEYAREGLFVELQLACR